MSTVATTAPSRTARVIAIISVVAGVVLLVAGGITWGSISSHLAAEHITVSEDAANFGGSQVTTPWTAFAQADIIAEHAEAATGGLTYAELDQDDPLREVAMNASFLRASLFTSVVAFGVAALVMGLGVMFVLIGLAIWVLGARRAVTTTHTAERGVAVPVGATAGVATAPAATAGGHTAGHVAERTPVESPAAAPSTVPAAGATTAGATAAGTTAGTTGTSSTPAGTTPVTGEADAAAPGTSAPGTGSTGGTVPPSAPGGPAL